MADLLTIGTLRKALRDEAVSACVHAQIEALTRKEDRNGKPYFEIKLRDSGDNFSLKAWSNSPNFARCEELSRGQAVEIEGDFALGSYGIDAARWALRFLDEDEAAELFAGDETSRATNEEDFDYVTKLVATIGDPRLQALTAAFLEDFGPRFRRATAARNNHHAFRGGLLRHTAQMMKTADAISIVYPRLNRDLLLTGALFHDSGKLWEMCPPEQGFDVPRELRGELLGHISIGIELVNALWRKVNTDEWKALQPPSEDVRLHLLHLVAAHHGELQYGSPVEPKTPEAIALHYIDNLDARLEMIFAAYEKQTELAPGIYERIWALNTTPVRGLAAYQPPLRLKEDPADEADLVDFGAE